MSTNEYDARAIAFVALGDGSQITLFHRIVASLICRLFEFRLFHSMRMMARRSWLILDDILRLNDVHAIISATHFEFDITVRGNKYLRLSLIHHRRIDIIAYAAFASDQFWAFAFWIVQNGTAARNAFGRFVILHM